ncbi:MAG: DNA polymerase III subunit beta, partial [Oscillospiraceae bacterium]|nr:DNA polymerase III subunit beta [Oscillospiraceae bacterium]
MKFTCDRTLLQVAVNTVSRACSARSPIPALEGILLEAGQQNLKLTGYDLKKGIYTHMEAGVDQMGSIILPARMFSDIVHSLPDGDVELKTEKLYTTIRCGSAEFHIVGSDPTDYPELPAIEGQTGISLPQNQLRSMIRETIFAVSDNEARPIYTGELFDLRDGVLNIVAVDGYRLAIRRETVENVSADSSFIVPGSALSDIEKLCGDSDEPIHIHVGDKHIGFTIGDTVLISRRLEGEFLNYHKAVPDVFNVLVRADCRELQRTIERVSLIIDTKIKTPLRCIFERDQLRIVCATALGRAEDFCTLDGDGKGLEIGFNNRYLLDVLKSAPTEDIRICLNSGSAP